MRSSGQQGRPAGQGAAVYSSAGGAGQAAGQGGSFLGSLGIGGQPAAGDKGAGEAVFKGKAHTLGESRFQIYLLLIATTSRVTYLCNEPRPSQAQC